MKRLEEVRGLVEASRVALDFTGDSSLEVISNRYALSISFENLYSLLLNRTPHSCRLEFKVCASPLAHYRKLVIRVIEPAGLMFDETTLGLFSDLLSNYGVRIVLCSDSSTPAMELLLPDDFDTVAREAGVLSA